jgi:hypothetical protein
MKMFFYSLLLTASRDRCLKVGWHAAIHLISRSVVDEHNLKRVI